MNVRVSVFAALLVTACAGPATAPAATLPATSATASTATPTATPELTKPPRLLRTESPPPLPTTVRWSVDFFEYAPHRPLLVLYADSQATFRILDASGALVASVPIAGSGIFGPDACVSRLAHQGFSTWVGLDRATMDVFLARYRSYRIVAQDAAGRETTLELADSGCRSEPAYVGEAEAWARVRRALPGLALPTPTWLPETIDRGRVFVGRITTDPARPWYELIYVGSKGAITFALGSWPEIEGSGYGTRVRGTPATLTFSQSLWSEPQIPMPRRVRWTEGANTFTIDSTEHTGDELLRIAWSLDRSGSPLATVARPAPGACAAAAPIDTVRRLLSLMGSRNGDAVSDCFGEGLRGWESLPAASVESMREAGTVGGRRTVMATWTFATDPGGAWGPRPTRFFQLGAEDGVWRIYEVATAPLGPPP